MTTYTRFAHALRFEGHLLSVVWRSRNCLPSRIALALSLAYWISPWQVIPDGVPVFGYSDELVFTLCGLVAARLLIPSRLEYHTARQLWIWDGNDRATCGVVLAAHVRSEIVTQWLIIGRRAFRLKAHACNLVSKAHSRCRAVGSGSNPRDIMFAILGYRLWWFLRSPFATPRSEAGPIVVIGGAARSGTTLLRTTLGRHPLIASVPETTVFLRRVSSPTTIGERLGWDPALVLRWQRESRSQAEFIAQVQRAVLQETGKAIWAEKTPHNIQRLRFVRRHFRSAKLVHIIRDGRDVVCSLRRTPFAKLDHAHWDSVAATRRCAVQWRTSVKAGLRLRGDPAYYELRYEDLVRNPEPALRALLGFLGIPWDDGVLIPMTGAMDDADAARAAGQIFDSSIGRWRRDLSQADRNTLRLLIGPQLVRLGYESDLVWPAAGPSSDQRAPLSAARGV